jgi:hypothetical protein
MALDTLSRESNTGHLLTSLGSSTVACQLLRDYLIEHCQDMQENAPQRLAAAAKETAEYARSLGEEAYAEAYDQLADAANAGDVTVVPATLTPEAKPSAKTVH